MTYFIDFTSFYPFVLIAPWVRDKRNSDSSVCLATYLGIDHEADSDPERTVCPSYGRGARGAGGEGHPGRGGEGGGAVCWEGAERRPGNHQGSGPDDRPGGRPAGQVGVTGGNVQTGRA